MIFNLLDPDERERPYALHPAFEARVADSILRIESGESKADIAESHGRVVVGEALKRIALKKEQEENR